MKSFLSFASSKLPYDSVAIGKFDGMHKAHKYLLKLVGKNGCALSIASVKAPFITPPQRREKYSCVPFFRLRFEYIKTWDSLRFLKLLFMVMPNLQRIIIGYDFCFGKDRMHTASDLKLLLQDMGKDSVKIEIIEPQKYHDMPIHTSIIKELLQYGDIQNANSMLDRFYHIKGRIIKGQGIGTTMLYPTINMQNTLYFSPEYGVYATFAYYGNTLHKAVSFIGNRLSTDKRFCIETHIIDANIYVERNEFLQIFFVEYLRDNRHFKELSELKEQIKFDINKAKELLAKADIKYCR